MLGWFTISKIIGKNIQIRVLKLLLDQYGKIELKISIKLLYSLLYVL